ARGGAGRRGPAAAGPPLRPALPLSRDIRRRGRARSRIRSRQRRRNSTSGAPGVGSRSTRWAVVLSTDARTPQGSGDLAILFCFAGADHARDALLYGARDAQRAGTQLTVVNAYTSPPMVYGVPAEFSVEDSLEVNARTILDE